MSQRECSIEGCGRPVESYGWCTRHATRWRKHGDPLKVLPRGGSKPIPLMRRFWKNVRIEGTCWIWTKSLNSNGYGTVKLYGRTERAHRASYIEFVGPIPTGMEIDHLCRNRACVNPDHMEVVTHRENTMRGNTIVARQARQTHCVNGHAFTPENTGTQVNGGRRCLACKRINGRAYYYRRKARSLDVEAAE